jgi:hypothetical protein
MEKVIRKAREHNPWFTRENILSALGGAARMLESEQFLRWLEHYDPERLETESHGRIGVIMAGNIPMVGFHDMLCVLVSGHGFLGKLSGQDAYLIPFLAEKITEWEPAFAQKISFTDRLSGFNAVIATGSNNTSRYFEYYFGKYPHIIRKNRNSAAILTGRESEEELWALGKDIFSYFGMGCRNVSKLFVPRGYNFSPLLGLMSDYPGIGDHHKYVNNYDYIKSVYLLNRTPFLDNGILLLKEDQGFASPTSVLFYEFYEGTEELRNRLEKEKETLQCIVSNTLECSVPFGKTQEPEVSDYADGIDTIKFLLGLKDA